VFTLAGTTWSQQASVLPAGAQPGDYFGSRFVLSGDGSLLATSSQGKVVLYDHTGTSWTQGQTLTAANAEGVYAMAASADGRKLLVGAPTDPSCSSVTTGGDPSNAGCVTAGASYLFERTGQTWSSTYLKATNTDAHDLFGSSGAMSSDGAARHRRDRREQPCNGRQRQSDRQYDAVHRRRLRAARTPVSRGPRRAARSGLGAARRGRG